MSACVLIPQLKVGTGIVAQVRVSCFVPQSAAKHKQQCFTIARAAGQDASAGQYMACSSMFVCVCVFVCVSQVQRVISSMISTCIVFALFAVCIHALGIYRGLAQADQDIQGA